MPEFITTVSHKKIRGVPERETETEAYLDNEGNSL